MMNKIFKNYFNLHVEDLNENESILFWKFMNDYEIE